MKRKVILITAALVLLVSVSGAEGASPAGVSPANAGINQQLSDWRPKNKVGDRYIIAVHPGHLLQHGLKFDFDKELSRSGRWLGFSLMGYHTPHYKEKQRDKYNLDAGWISMCTDYSDVYTKLWGGGAGVTYRHMFGESDWYFSTGLLFNYFDVDYKDVVYVPFKEDGLVFYEEKIADVNRKFYKPGVNINVGRFIMLSKHFLVDWYIGLGYSHSFYEGAKKFDSMFGFGYRGFQVSGGVRAGFLWKSKQKPTE